MASSSKRKGYVRTVEWWKHLRDMKRVQEQLVRSDQQKQIDRFWAEEMDDPDDALIEHFEERMQAYGYDPDNFEHCKECFGDPDAWKENLEWYQEWIDRRNSK